jgi:hypothetical protein
LGVVVQVVLLTGDSFATRMRIPVMANPNPYSRTLGGRALATAAGNIAREVGAKTIAAETRYDVAALLYYWRDQPERVVAWQTEELESFDLSNPLTDSAAEPIVFVTACPFAKRLMPSFVVRSDQRLAIDVGTAGDRFFHAFVLADRKGPVQPLGSCVGE